MFATLAPWSVAHVSPDAMSLMLAPESGPTWTIMSLQFGQKPALPASLPTARLTIPATYVPWLPAPLVTSVLPVRTFHVDEISPSKSDKPVVLIPVSSEATTTDGS